jgi:CRISPR-associated endonuclease Csy4
MDYYVDIHALPNAEVRSAHILSALASKLHNTLVDLRTSDIGISFPQFMLAPVSLGATLRLHGSCERLTQLMSTGFWRSLRDYIDVSVLAEVPPATLHRIVRRVQAKSSAERIRRRQMRRHGWTEEEARKRIPDACEKRLSLPFLQMKSRSTGQPFRLFIEHQECTERPIAGTFNAYGLSAGATVPWF